MSNPEQCSQLVNSKPEMNSTSPELHNSLDIQLIDINNAFLNGDLNEQPQGFVSPNSPSHACCLTKALYGLKQAPRTWFHKLKTALMDWRLKSSSSDVSLFLKRFGDLLLLVYVDDILLTDSSPTPTLVSKDLVFGSGLAVSKAFAPIRQDIEVQNSVVVHSSVDPGLVEETSPISRPVGLSIQVTFAPPTVTMVTYSRKGSVKGNEFYSTIPRLEVNLTSNGGR
ncbi:hypothetical protein LWI29_006219 [Acer saccharum]|uniref:Reverse transcriptase Ty1/copia-type domain-containing protein n=1 Tax=Acer saccharum TaxID=4024 RepID=A0AA39VK76_ACESA|nr:hypothetical protein LWI29_006219 [Acer saccharum]